MEGRVREERKLQGEERGGGEEYICRCTYKTREKGENRKDKSKA